MKLKLLFSIGLVVIFYSCKSNNERNKANEATIESTVKKRDSVGYTLLKNNCYACHSVIAHSHDAIIAPPMTAVKRRYKVSYKTKEEFVEAITNWVVNPIQENALMRGAVTQFNVMPKQPFNKKDIVKIAEYIYDHELEKPVWFDEHFNEEHPNGMGKGQGRSKGMRNN